MNRKIRYCNKKPINQIAFQAQVKGIKKWVEGLGAEIKTNEYQALFTTTPESIAAKKKARSKRLSKSLNRQVEKSIATAAGRGYG